MKQLIISEVVEQKILLIRGQKVMIDSDLAKLYGVPTKRLNEQVKRNHKRFPGDFMFRLTESEKKEVVAICDHLYHVKFSNQLPLVFTEQGVAMLSSVLNSERAALVNIAIMRTFVKLRQMIVTYKDLANKLAELERKIQSHDEDIITIFRAIRQLTIEETKPKNKIGFL